ncbi:molybdopterin-dependent oxidoreductase [Deinococcus cellulosilyticus]|uniref:Uncharacterized protein n=1 Tax=Deinococcus cellulosilyticus (strain DSM 18568 / NBRC 106333 / KACC 11606 / 5516J-15) TaxID=1223518 RepID=A0A511N3J0_DEIC1|nr:molybdopterin-dependent oxidoreductase [Deinococcus cellulosilyticus]GEM47430.1 hypothetical protein DC3_30650 [Deinococcus cellulosilyticus NBRC 106333 = KACC 11606]
MHRFVSGFSAAVIFSVLGLAGRVWGQLPYPPQVIFDRITQFLGTPVMFNLIHDLLGVGQGGKIAAFVGVLLMWLGGLSLLGVLSPILAATVILLVLVLLVPFPWALAHALLYLLVRLALQPATRSFEQGRRKALTTLGAGSALLTLGATGGLFKNVLQGTDQTSASAFKAGSALPEGIVSQEDLYYVSKNLEGFDPVIEAQAWTLKVGGLVERPTNFSLDDLKRFQQRDLELTLNCISNPVGGFLIGNAIWTGFTVRDLLNQVGVKQGAKFIIWKAADGYVESLPLGEAHEEDVLLVHSINGEPLTPKHGFPLRVLIPGRYGMKQPRWITEIELSRTDIPSYWSQRGWDKEALIKPSSRFDFPEEGKPVPAGQEILMKGVAFAGRVPITKVEVSVDGGKNWQEAKLSARRSVHAWTLWSLPWTPETGIHEVVVRAYAAGKLQTEATADPLPGGSTGWHRFLVNVS